MSGRNTTVGELDSAFRIAVFAVVLMFLGIGSIGIWAFTVTADIQRQILKVEERINALHSGDCAP